MGLHLGIFREVARGRQLSQARAEAGGSGPHCPGRKRHGGGPPDAASQAEAVCQFPFREHAVLNSRKRAVEMTGDGKRENQNQVSLRFPPPLEIAPRFPQSHNPDDDSPLPKTQNQKARKEPQRLKKPQPPSSGSSFDEKMLGLLVKKTGGETSAQPVELSRAGGLRCRRGLPYGAKSLYSGEEREYHVGVGVPNWKFWFIARGPPYAYLGPEQRMRAPNPR